MFSDYEIIFYFYAPTSREEGIMSRPGSVGVHWRLVSDEYLMNTLVN
jgi:hypothetical protein